MLLLSRALRNSVINQTCDRENNEKAGCQTAKNQQAVSHASLPHSMQYVYRPLTM